jgi:hypothetical protein
MPFLGLLFSNRLTTTITLIVLGSGAFFGWLAVHDHDIYNKAIASFNQMQQELLQQKQEEFQQQTQVINDNGDQIKHDLEDKDRQLADANAEIERKAIEENKGTNESSPYLKSIVKQLDKTYGTKK